jgi:glucose/arabinose dehydrogenase/cytochrome c2
LNTRLHAIEAKARRARLVLAAAAALACAGAQGQPAGNVAHGQSLFQDRCGTCHASGAQGGGGQGPDLGGVVGRKAGSTEFGYSPALRHATFSWTTAQLDRFLTNPAAAVPGTTMPVGVADASERHDLVAYLSTLPAAATAGAAHSANGPAGSVATAAAGTLLTGRNAYGDWRTDAPGVRRLIRVDDLIAPYASPSVHNNSRIIDPPAGATVRVPAGFSAVRFATGLAAPRLIRVAPNGDIFIAETAAGRIAVLRAQDGALKPDSTSEYATGLNRPFGMAFYPSGPNPQWLYVANINSVVRFAYHNGELRAGAPETIVAQLAPTTGGHSTRDIVFTPNSQQMFVSVGSSSNVAEGASRRASADIKIWDEQRGLGAGWGADENRADVLVFDPDGHNGRVYASGIRNCVGLGIQPQTGMLWCSTNERDGLGDDLPPDYVTRVRQGAFYGWPWYYIGNHEDPRHVGQRPDLAGHVTVPDVLIQPHSAPLELAFYDAAPDAPARFPAEYRGDAFVALHGSWNRALRTGYKVIRVRQRDGAPTGDYEDFVTGFVLGDDQVWGRPVGVAVAHDGALLVTDDGNGTLWRIAPAAAGAAGGATN